MKEDIKIHITNYEVLKRNKDVIKSIDKEYFFELVDRLIKGYRELEEENYRQRSQLMSAFDRGFIHKSKVKEKIEELNSKSGGNTYPVQCVINAQKRVLQELMEDK